MTEAGQDRMSHDVAADAAKLRALHVPGEPLLLANIWDPPSARAVEAAGMPAIATASAALAPVNGFEDHGKLPPDMAFAALRRIADAVSCPVTADLEDGYGLPPNEIASRLVEAGACGLNLEDSDNRTGELFDRAFQAERIAGIKEAGGKLGVDLVINARVDAHLRKLPFDEGLRRAQSYLAAGADCLYPIFLSDPAAIRDYVSLGPVNVLCLPQGSSLAELAALGVVRISVGPLLHKAMLARLGEAAEAMRRYDDAALWGRQAVA